MNRRAVILMSGLVLVACTPQQDPTSRPQISTPSPEPAAQQEAPANIADIQEGAKAGYAGSDSGTSGHQDAVASLGSPSVPGLWVRAPFIEEGKEVEVFASDTGKAVLVTSGPTSDIVQMSLAGFQALGVSPAELIPVEIRTP
ncbi:hypothetical protein ACGYLO_18275 [Sulfitobacter sp. 1A13353]|uniref:hypothetical protein n=1 Tax=Sulfitobacter sp. 1A13353 TaxID=3368568 RepID=UPI0037450414